MVREKINGWAMEWYKPIVTSLITGVIVALTSYAIQVPVLRAEMQARLLDHDRRIEKVESYCVEQIKLQREVAERLMAIETELRLMRENQSKHP